MDTKQIEESTETLNELLKSYSVWEGEARVLGNVKASEAIKAITFAKRVIFLFQRGVKFGCSSNCCLVYKPKGQGTNGGCTCFDDISKSYRIIAKKQWSELINGIA